MTYTPEEIAAAAKFIEAVYRKPERIDGLTPTETRIVATLKQAGGRMIPGKELAKMTMHRPPTRKFAIVPWISNIRRKRPDIGACIVSARWAGYGWHEAMEAAE